MDALAAYGLLLGLAIVPGIVHRVCGVCGPDATRTDPFSIVTGKSWMSATSGTPGDAAPCVATGSALVFHAS